MPLRRIRAGVTLDPREWQNAQPVGRPRFTPTKVRKAQRRALRRVGASSARAALGLAMRPTIFDPFASPRVLRRTFLGDRVGRAMRARFL